MSRIAALTPATAQGAASGLLMTGHEVGATLGVAVLSAAHTTAGSLTSPAGAVAGFSRAFVAAVIVPEPLAVEAFVKMPSTHVTGGGGNLHMH